MGEPKDLSEIFRFPYKSLHGLVLHSWDFNEKSVIYTK